MHAFGATVDSQSVKETHAGAIHQSLAGLLRIAGHFLIAFGRLSHYPLDLRMTNQQLTQTGGTCTHANPHIRTLSGYLFTQELPCPEQHNARRNGENSL